MDAIDGRTRDNHKNRFYSENLYFAFFRVRRNLEFIETRSFFVFVFVFYFFIFSFQFLQKNKAVYRAGRLFPDKLTSTHSAERGLTGHI